MLAAFLSVLVVPTSLGSASMRVPMPQKALDVTASASRSVPKAPARFIENLGQWPNDVRYAAHLRDGDLLVECTGFTAISKARGDTRDHVRMSFVGARQDVTPIADQPDLALYSYFRGNDPSRWRGGARAFAEVRFEEVYPGIDFVLHTPDDGLKYDILVAAGANETQLVLKCELLGDTAALDDGQLGSRTESEILLHLPGYTYVIDEDGSHVAVTCEWRALGGGRFALHCPDRDRELPLVVDPELLWSTYLGSSNDFVDRPAAMDIDANGDIYVVGETHGTDFPITPGAYHTPSSAANDEDIYLAKFRGSDGALLFSSVFGGLDDLQERAVGVGVDDLGQAVVVGNTQSADFPTTPGAWDPVKTTSFSVVSGFATKFSASGDGLIYSTFIEGSAGDKVWGVDMLPTGHALVCGTAFSPDFPVTTGALDTTRSGISDGYVLKLLTDGSGLAWSTLLGGSGGDGSNCVAVTRAGDLVVIGVTASPDFPVTPGAIRTTPSSAFAAILTISRIAGDGSSLLWATYFGGTSGSEFDQPSGVSLDAFDNVYFGGITNTTTWPTTPGSWMPEPSPGSPTALGFLTRIRSDGAELQYSTFTSTVNYQTGPAGRPRADASGVVTAFGGTSVFPWPMTPGAYDTTNDASGGPMLARLDPSGSHFYYATYVDGPQENVIADNVVDSLGRVTAHGMVYSPGGWPTTPGAHQPYYAGGGTDTTVTTLWMYLQGVEPHGASTPACHGPINMNAVRMPSAGAADFGFYASGAPSNANGWLILGRRAINPIHQGPLDLWVNVNLGTRVVRVTTDAYGFIEKRLALPTNFAGKRLTAQFVFRNNAACPGTGPFSASNAIVITGQ
jgi:hypothetical protein